jgi:hypothetical protein
MIFEPCWVCGEAPGTADVVRNRGTCGRCYYRLQQRYGKTLWEKTARDMIADGKRLHLLGMMPCPTCARGRIVPLTNKTGVCDACNDKNKRQAKRLGFDPDKRVEELGAAARRRAEAEAEARIAQFIEARKAGLARDRERVASQIKARIQTQRIAALTQPKQGIARIDDPRSFALVQARQNPGRNVIPVPMGEGDSFHYVYFAPFINAKGDIDVRPCPDHLKAP